MGWGPNIFVQNSFLWSDVVSWTRGAHSMKFGVGYTREHADNDSARAVTRPTYSFASVFDFAADQPTSQSQIAIDPRIGAAPDSIKRFHRTQSLSAFVQDEWKVRPNVTLSAGLRYEAFMNITDASDDIVTNIEFPVQTGNLQSDLASARMVQRQWYLNGGTFGPQHTFAPRVSFAWDPTNKGQMSIRGGVGRFYERMSNQIWDSEHQNLPGYGSASVTIFQPVKPLFTLGASNTLPYGFPYPPGLTAGVRPNGGLLNGTAGVVAADSRDAHHAPRQLVPRGAALARPVRGGRSQLHRLPGRQHVLPLGHQPLHRRPARRNLNRIMPGFSAVNYAQAIDESSYNGFTFSARVQRKDLHLGAAYTYGKATDRSSSATVGPATPRPDAYGPDDQDEGPADHDIRQKMAVSLNWNLPGPDRARARPSWEAGSSRASCWPRPACPTPCPAAAASSRFATAPASSWATAAATTTPTAPTSTGPTPRPSATRASGSDDDFLNGIFTASEFPVPGLGQNGTLGRNTFRGPSYFNVDLALVKTIHVPFFTSQGADLQLRVESFNLFNTVNLANPIGDLSNPNFGKSTAALPGRIVQFGLRFQF